jgi:raffinose/stachyose/melibiose transport system substrate-binding protein
MSLTHRLTRKRAFFTLMAILCLSLSSVVVLAQDEPTIVTWWTATPVEQQEIFLNSFNEAHTDIQIEMVYSEDLVQVLGTSLSSGRGPDIIETRGPAFSAEYANANLLLDLTPYAETHGWTETLLPWAYQSGLVNEGLYSIPQTFETFVLFYNVDMFEENGWPAPESIADINSICESATEKGIWCFSHGGGGTASEWYVGTFLSHHAGSDHVYQALNSEIPWNDPVFVNAIEALKSQVDAGWWSGNVQNYFSFGWGDYQANFCQGYGAMMVSGTWDFNFIDEFCAESGVELNWDWVIVPSLREGVEPSFDLAIGNSLAVNARTEHPEAAAEVLNWVVNDPQRALEQAAGFNFGEWFVPLDYDLNDLPADLDPRVGRYIETFSEVTGAGFIGYTTWTFLPIETDTLLIQGLSSVLNGDISAEQYLTEINDSFIRQVEEGKVPPAPQTAVVSPEFE